MAQRGESLLELRSVAAIDAAEHFEGLVVGQPARYRDLEYEVLGSEGGDALSDCELLAAPAVVDQDGEVAALRDEDRRHLAAVLHEMARVAAPAPLADVLDLRQKVTVGDRDRVASREPDPSETPESREVGLSQPVQLERHVLHDRDRAPGVGGERID